MIAKISPRPLSGGVAAIASKSAAHRLLICAALADGETKLFMNAMSQDILATMRCLEALGAEIYRDDSGVVISPVKKMLGAPLLECGESGSTLRFLLPVGAAMCEEVSFTGTGRLTERPIGELLSAMGLHGVSFSSQHLPLTTRGKLYGGEYRLPGNVSSQFITGLLLALPLTGEESAIKLTTHLESAAYLDMTLSAMERFGVKAECGPEGFNIAGGQSYKTPGTVDVEGDWSNAAFFLAAGALGQTVTVTGLDESSAQGDRAIAELLAGFGAEVEKSGRSVTVSPGKLRGQVIDVSQVPDLLPILSVVAACAEGETRLVNAARLRIKESDRLAAAAKMLKALGGRVTELADGLIIEGGSLTGGETESFGDHRMAMSAAVAAIRCSAPVAIADAQAVNKSYPGFFEDYNRLGGMANVL